MKQATHKIDNREYIFIEVPKYAYNFFINKVGCIRYSEDLGRISSVIEPTTLGIYATEDNCMIISTLSNISEEDAEKIVYRYTNYEMEHEQLLHGMYEDYLEKGNYWVQDSSGIKLWAFKTAKESLQSLINCLGLSGEVLILEK